MSYNRYKSFVENGTMHLVPFIKIPNKNTDYYEYYELGKTRLDLLSYKYYNDPNYDWLIMQANPEYGSLEFNIPNKSLLRIPFPLESTISQYYADIEKYKELYGFK
jgi:hypothetical protein